MRTKKRMNKKGSMIDLIVIGAMLLVFAVSLLIGFAIMTNINTTVQDSSMNVPGNLTTSLDTLQGYYPGVLDNTFLFLTIGLCLVTIVLAALVRIHPIFMVFFFIGWIIIIFISAILSNVYQTMAAEPMLSPYADQMMMTSNIMNYLPWFVAVFGIILMVVMYKVGDTMF